MARPSVKAANVLRVGLMVVMAFAVTTVKALTRRMTEEEMDIYRAPFLEPESRYPIYMWPNELPIGGTPARNVRVVERVGKWLRT